jgi:hypothetical protein
MHKGKNFVHGTLHVTLRFLRIRNNIQISPQRLKAAA